MKNSKNSTAKMHFACAIVFITFTYLYLACYQGDVLAVAQHVLSDGKTDYSYTFAPLLTTLVFFLLQLGVYAATRVSRTFHALTYFPSFLFLTMITDIPNDMDVHHSLGGWWIAIPLCLIAWGAAMWVARQLEPIQNEPHSYGWLSQYMWVNLLQMIVMMILMISISSSDTLFHERMKMERLMKEKKYTEALEVGEKSALTDSSLTMLRIACLHETGQMGSRLFTYPLVGGSRAMKPDSITVKALMWRAPQWMQKPSPWKQKHHLKNLVPVDYQLCGLLLDKKLDKFVVALHKAYPDSVKLPTHYKEALTLYTHSRTNPLYVFHDNVMDADFQDYQQMEHKYATATERKNALHDTYGNTYWYYYQYGNK